MKLLMKLKKLINVSTASKMKPKFFRKESVQNIKLPYFEPDIHDILITYHYGISIIFNKIF